MSRPTPLHAVALLPLLVARAPAADDPAEWRDARPNVPRAEWDALEGEPAPPLASLADWKNCDGLTWEGLRGNVVLLDRWGGWCPPCRKATPHLVELFEEHRDRGLVVLGIHSDYRWDGGRVEGFLDEHGVGYAVARDDSNVFKESLHVRMWPAYYIVDRDGNVRVAGVAKGEDADGGKYLDHALEAVLAEPWEGERRTVELRPRERRAEKETSAAPAASRPKRGPAPKPEPAALRLDAEGWPVRVEKKLYAKNDFRGRTAPELAVETWLTAEPDLEGKVVLVDFWATWCGPCKRAMPHLQALQDAFAGDLVVIGISDQAPDAVNPRTRRPWGDVVGRYLASQPRIRYAQAIDGRARMKDALGVVGIPHVLLYGADRTVRWQGFPADPVHPLTEEVVAAVVAADRKRRGLDGQRPEPDDPPDDDARGGDNHQRAHR